MNLTEEQRLTLERLANVLIPSGEGLPSASEAGVAGPGLDRVLAARPDLAGALPALLEMALHRDPAEVIDELQTEDPAAFAVLAELVPGAYFLNPEVRKALGYHGQNAQPIDPHPDYEDNGLLRSVIERGPIYRPTP